jgi:response regulator of citrate/malate metabolism
MKLLASFMIMAFIISKNKPSVTMVIGKVRMIRIGLRITFKTAKTTATIIASIIGSSRVTPGRKLAMIITDRALRSNFTISFMR